jgi:hypothetical protein
MSKRRGDVRVLDYMVGDAQYCLKFPPVTRTTLNLQEKGWEPEALVNWLALAGWNLRRPSDGFHNHESIKSSPETSTVPEDVMNLDQLINAVRSSHEPR